MEQNPIIVRILETYGTTKEALEEEFIEVRRLGRGSQGYVNLVRRREEEKEEAGACAAHGGRGLHVDVLAANEEREQGASGKLLAQKHVLCEGELELWLRLFEHELLHQVRHPNVTRLFRCDILTHADHVYEVVLTMEFCAGGDVGALMDEYRRAGTVFPEAEVLSIAQQVALALSFLHSNTFVDPRNPAGTDYGHMIYRDLKADNVFFADTDRTEVRLGDFGVSRVQHAPRPRAEVGGALPAASPTVSTKERHAMDAAAATPPSPSPETRMLTARVGTVAYMAPEMFEARMGELVHATTKVDVFSFGALLYYMTTLSFVPCLTDAATRPDYDPDALVRPRLEERGYSDDLITLIASCIERDPDARPTAVEIIDHPAFASLQVDEDTYSLSTATASHLSTPLTPFSDHLFAASDPLVNQLLRRLVRRNSTMTIGAHVSHAALEHFYAMTLRKEHRFVIMRFDDDDREIQLVYAAQREATFDDFMEALPHDGCCFGFFDLDVMMGSIVHQRVVLVTWFNEKGASVRERTRFLRVRNAIEMYLSDAIHGVVDAGCAEDLDIARLRQSVLHAATHQHHPYNAPTTAADAGSASSASS